MRLIIDANNSIYSSLFIEFKKEGVLMEENLNEIKHLFLNRIMMFKRKFEVKNNNIVVCFDHKETWRKKIFPFYKGKRKTARDKSDINFELVFALIDQMYEGLRQFFPFVTLRNQYMEADDWIAIVSKHCSELKEQCIIVSTDRDFIQLQKHVGIRQYDPLKKQFIDVNEPEKLLLVKIMCGDPGDGIPNILSDDDTFMNDLKRQKPFGEKKAWAAVIEHKNIEGLQKHFNSISVGKNFARNNRLINFDNIPDQIKTKALEKFLLFMPSKNKLLLEAFFTRNNLTSFLYRINEF